MFTALLASALAGLATGLGAIPAILLGRLSPRAYDATLGFISGVMLAAASFALIGPALTGGLLPVVVGVVAGAGFVHLLERLLPHLEPHFTRHPAIPGLRRGLLIAAAIAIHNLPEGMAVGAGYSAPGRLGLVLALGIAAHNIPEGMVVALPWRQAGMGAWKCVLLTVASGLTEPLGALLAVFPLLLVHSLMPGGLAFAGGAMLYVVVNELLPEAQGQRSIYGAGAIAGFLLMVAIQYGLT